MSKKIGLTALLLIIFVGDFYFLNQIPQSVAQSAKTEKIVATLNPQSSTPLGAPVIVSFGMPFPKDFLTNAEMISVKDSNGEEISAHVRVLLPWRDLSTGQNFNFIRSALIQFSFTFDSLNPVNITIEIGNSRTKNIVSEYPIKDNWVKVDDSKYPGSYNVYEPVVYVTLPPAWLGKCAIKSVTVPYGTYNDFKWYDDSLTNNNPAINDGQNFFKTMINDDSRVTEANDIDYLNVGEYEPWLFDRAMTIYMIYIRSGKVEVLREAHRAANFYSAHINSDGYFDIKTGNDLKYTYGESMITDLILTGDEEHLNKLDNIPKAAGTFNPIFNPNADHGLWTERHLTFAWLAYITAYEATGNVTYAEKARYYADTIFNHQNNPPYNIVYGTAPNDGGLLHSFLLHEGFWNDQRPYWVFSPWMSVLLVDAMERYYQQSGDVRVIASAKRFGDAIVNIGDTYRSYPTFGGTIRVPAYLCSSDTRYGNGRWDDYDDYNHCQDVAKITAFAYYCSKIEGAPIQKYLTETTELLYAAKNVLNSYIRPGAPASGLSIYRLSPARKGNWWFRTTADIDYLINYKKPVNTTPSVVLTLSADKNEVQLGDTITYTLTYQNTSSAEAKNIVITDPIPQGTTYVAGSATNGGVYDAANSRITWTISALVGGATGMMSFKVIIE